jgi:hypothetical protein
VGKKVPNDIVSDVFDKCLVALRSIHKCGTYRLKQLTLNLVFQGYEPVRFKQAFKSGWTPFSRPGMDDFDILEEDSEEEDQSESEGPSKKTLS